MATALIGGDWGSSNLRVFRYDERGTVLERRQSAKGILAISQAEFELVLAALVGDWLQASLPQRPPVLLSGMVGSRQGWVEAPYVACPGGLSDLAQQLVRATTGFGTVCIAPGLSAVSHDGCREVMRGEETQIFGADAGGAGAGPQLIVAPGTHSKWARLEHGRVTTFATYMTGELYAVLTAHSILGKLMRADRHDADAFALGVKRALADPAITRLLFSVRTEGLFNTIAEHALGSYLSGLLIGAEVAAVAAEEIPSAVTVIGNQRIAELYRTALELVGVASIHAIDGDDAAARGLWRLAQAGGLLGAEDRP